MKNRVKNELNVELNELKPCTDAVSRKPNCIDCIHKSVCFRLDMRVDSDYAEKCGDFLTELPPVTPSCDKCAMNGSGNKYCDNCRQKTGKWILTIEDWNKWTCSNCGYVKRTDIHVNIGWKYCPNCGAKMESEDKK